MPKVAKQPDPLEAKRREHIASGMTVCVFGLLWLACELGIIRTTLPVGPIVLVIAGLAMILPHMRKG